MQRYLPVDAAGRTTAVAAKESYVGIPSVDGNAADSVLLGNSVSIPVSLCQRRDGLKFDSQGDIGSH